VDGVVTIGNYTYTFEDYVLKLGAWFERDGVTKLKWAGVTLIGTWHTMDGVTYYFNELGTYAVGPVRIDMEQADGSVIQEYHEFDENGAHLGRLSDGLHVYEDLIVYTIDGVAQHAGLVMDEEGNYYYINSSKKGVRNTTYNISEAWTNGLLPAGTYAFDETGKMILA
jgi:hypothetical protein